jgi:hypothetical protein
MGRSGGAKPLQNQSFAGVAAGFYGRDTREKKIF